MLRSGVIVAGCTLLSRILGLVRELFIATTFGSGPIADSVNVAFKLPNLFRRIFAEGALASVFVPIFSSKLQESQRIAEEFASKIFWLLLLVLVIFVGLMQYFMPNLMIIIAPGFHLSPDKFELTVLLCQITMPYLFFISIAALLGSMLNSINKFAAFAFVPVILNLVVIVATVGLSNYMPSAHAISYSVALAGLAQVAFMIICISRAGLHIKCLPSISHTDPDVKKLLKLMVPAIISAGAAQMNLFISQSVASFIPGAVSILSYADRIYQFPLSIIGIAFATILLPELSKLYKSGDREKSTTTQNKAIKFALFLSIPCSIGIIALSHQIIHLIYEHGAFTSDDTLKTSTAISAFALGLPAFIMTKIFTPIFYANHDTKTPMKITIYALSVNTILNLILMIPFAHVGIALGSSIAGWYNLWLLTKAAKKYGYFSYENDLGKFVFKVMLCCGFMTLFIYLLGYVYGDWYYHESLIIKAASLSLTIILGFLVYVISGWLCGLYSLDLKNRLLSF